MKVCAQLFLLIALFLATISCTEGQPDASGATSLDINFPGGRRLSISGRVFGQVGSSADDIAPLPQVELLAIANGVSYTTFTAANGSFGFQNIPMRPNRDASDTDDWPTIVVYIAKTGWTFDGDNVTAGNQNWIKIHVDSSQADNTNNFAVDVGPLVMTQASFELTSSLLKVNNTLPSYWLTSGTTVGNDPTEENQVFMTTNEKVITLTFNMPVDTAYDANFVDIFSPTGTPVNFTGSWDATGTIYTIVPTTALVPDNNASTKYLLRIDRPVRAFNTNATGQKLELNNIGFNFNYMSATRDVLLTSVAPAFYPQIDGPGFTQYQFDFNAILKSGLVPTSNIVDVIAVADNICLQWNQVNGARASSGYQLWARNSNNNDAIWYDSSASWTFGLTGDGKATACSNHFKADFLVNNMLSGAAQLQLMVRPVDNANNVAPMNSVVLPLTIADNWNPSLTASSYSSTYLPGEQGQFFSPAPNGKFTFTFSEPLDVWSAVKNASLTPLSGLLTSLTASNLRLDSSTTGEAKLNLTFNVASTTLARSAKKGDTRISLSAASGLRKNYKIKFTDTANQVNEDGTVSSVNTMDNTVVLTAPLGNNYPSGSAVRLSLGENAGHTFFSSSLTADAGKSATTITVANGALFFVGETVNIFVLDIASANQHGPYTISGIVGNVLTLTAPLLANSPSGSLVVDTTSGTTATEILPRQASLFSPTAEVQFSNTAANTTLATSNFNTTPDAQLNVILVAATANLNVDDAITIGSSDPVSQPLSVEAIPTNTTLTFTANPFVVGDLIRITPASIHQNLGHAVVAGDTTMTVSTATSVVNTESIVLTDPAFATELQTAAIGGAVSITVANGAGIAAGQTITIDSGVEAAETQVVASVAANVITIPGLTNNHAAGSRITRPLTTETVTAAGDVANLTAIPISAAANNYSLTTLVSVTRNYADFNVTAANATTATIAAVPAGAFFPAGTPVVLLSYPETRRITAINGKLLTLSSNLAFTHRANAAVTKNAQANIIMNAANMTTFMVGDTVVCNRLPVPAPAVAPYAHNDRFQGTITAYDGETGWLNIATAQTGLVTNADAAFACENMGDAVQFAGVLDQNGQAVRTTWGNKTDLGAVGTPE